MLLEAISLSLRSARREYRDHSRSLAAVFPVVSSAQAGLPVCRHGALLWTTDKILRIRTAERPFLTNGRRRVRRKRFRHAGLRDRWRGGPMEDRSGHARRAGTGGKTTRISAGAPRLQELTPQQFGIARHSRKGRELPVFRIPPGRRPRYRGLPVDS